MRNRILFISVLLVSIVIIGNNVFHETYAKSYDLVKTNLFFYNDINRMEDNIKNYLLSIDGLLVANSSFEYSSILSNNYDFLINFACSYVLDNQEYYVDEIKLGDSFGYRDKNNNINETNKYISLDIIYEITDKYFGIRDFNVINSNVKVMNNYISLGYYEKSAFMGEIEDIDIRVDDNFLVATVEYNTGNMYLYTFRNCNNVLKIYNVEVLV